MRQIWKSCAGICLLVVLCGVLAVLQYRWIGQVADAERTGLQQDLQDRLSLVRRDFDSQINAACASFLPMNSEIERLGRAPAYLEQYHRVIGAQEQLVRRIALAVPRDSDLDLLMLHSGQGDAGQDRFEKIDWPPAWGAMRQRLRARLRGGPIPSGQSAGIAMAELPRFGDGPGREGEEEWLVLELNQDYILSNLLPSVVAKHFGDSGRLDYDTKVVLNGDPSIVVYRSPAENEKLFAADATVPLLDINAGARGGGPGRGPGPPPEGRGFGGDKKRGPKGGPPAPGNPGASAWLLSVQHRAGSLEALVATTRRRNLGISAGILLLILATAAMMMRASRETQKVAELQMNFVAGVSHELRTPLTVIRTAAFNLRRTFSSNPDQVERYGELIQKESEKLGALVDQVLRYGSARAGSVIQQTEPVAVEALIESSLRASGIPAQTDLVVEKKIDPGLPTLLADEVALKHALQNLFDNAAKHGAAGHWVGIFAASRPGPSPVVEIRVADRGPGIPVDERAHIFDPFFRGRRALEDQVHGTGLGLNLVKRIIEAHGGTIAVKSEPAQGTEFVLRIPTGRMPTSRIPTGPRTAEATS